ncbi:hypothetical protein ACC677_37590, partial [Rhizobium ruizarguesonis]
ALFSETILLLGGAVFAAPIFKKLGLCTVLGYLAAGIVIGPVFHGITDGEQILNVAEDVATHLPEAGGFQLQSDDEEQEDDAEFG